MSPGRRSSLAVGCLGISLMSCVGSAQAQPVERPRPIIVIARPPTFEVAPDRSLDSADVAAYGLSSVGEVLDEIAAENGDTREDAVFLVNGKRVGGIGDVEDLPSEAVARIDVLPVGSGLKVGANSGQRVYAVALLSELDLTALRAGVRVATRGSWGEGRGEASYTQIRGDRRMSVTAKLRDADLLRESDRNVIQPAGAIADVGRYRSLSSDGDRIDFGISVADQLNPWLSGSLNARLSTSRRQALLGPWAPSGIAERPLEQRRRSFAGSAELTLNAELDDWLVSLFGNYAYERRRTLTDRAVAGLTQPAVSRTVARTENLGGLLSASGPLFDLPAGPLRLQLAAAVTRDTIGGERRLQGAEGDYSTALTTTTLSAGVEVPIASKAEGVFAGLGDLTASVEFSHTQVSGFGGFDNRTFSLFWKPARWLRLTGSFGRSGGAPSVAYLDEPPIETPGVRYFDPLRAETVEVTEITGGTPSLPRHSAKTRRISAQLKPIRSLALQVTAEYLETSNRNLASDLPPASAAIFKAFSERFIRDDSGRLIIVDARPVSFLRAKQRQLRFAFNINLPLGKARGAAGSADGTTATAAESGAGVPPRLQINASHRWPLGSDVVIRPGQPAIDLLSRDAIGFGGQGLPRHELDLNLGYAERGLGARLTVQYHGASYLEASGTTANVLRFAPLTTFRLRGWVQGERAFPDWRFARSTRLSLTIVNLTDARERVADRLGLTPLNYQKVYRDQIGRTIEIELRKTF